MNDASEKRRHSRYSFRRPVQVFPVVPSHSGNIYEVQKQSIEGRAHNISEGGLRLEADLSRLESSVLKLNFEVERESPVEVYGKVIWTEKNHYGIRFMLADTILRKGVHSIARKSAPLKN